MPCLHSLDSSHSEYAFIVLFEKFKLETLLSFPSLDTLDHVLNSIIRNQHKFQPGANWQIFNNCGMPCWFKCLLVA